MVAQSSKPRKMSVAEFMALPDDGNRHELVRGELRVTPSVPPPKSKHGFVETTLLAAIDRYLENKALAAGWQPAQGISARVRAVGFVGGGEFGMQFTLPDDPSQIRGADGVYVPTEQLAAVDWTWESEDYFPAVPHLVIEVLSASESAGDMLEKMQDYLAGGAHRVWYVDPRRRAIYIYDAVAPMRVVRGDDMLTDAELLPGFALALNLIFPTS
jgi:Uma2 family endonuclease